MSDRLFHLCPVKNGWSIIGLTGKHLAPATVINPLYSENQITFQVKQDGEFAIYLKDGTPKATGLKFKKDMVEREEIINSLQEHNGNITQTAK